MENGGNSHGEIIIVRRSGGGHDDEHHGGVWKIAFADFMTAMMAFFLVMWLINASNEQTRKGVASYFNPIKLMDTTSNPKGVRNPKYGVEQKNIEVDEESTKVSDTAKELVAAETPDTSFVEKALFVDPFALLSEIEGGISRDAELRSSEEDSSSEYNKGVGLVGGVSFQDPFDPSVWNIREGTVQKHGQDERDFTDESNNIRSESDTRIPVQARSEASEGTLDTSKDEHAKLDIESPGDEKSPDDPQGLSSFESEVIQAELDSLLRDLDATLKQLKNDAEYAQLDIDLVRKGYGASVVLSDKSQNGMFNIGSARPTKALVKAMSRVGELIAKHGGLVEISGHTDGRKYQSIEYDNWRLSTARAHMAHYMLLRGGMKEEQVERIVGEADARLKVPEDPYSPANRRIEVRLAIK